MPSTVAQSEQVAGKVAIVTGATRGLGRQIALALGRAGCRLVIAGRSTSDAPNRHLPGTLEETATALESAGVEVEAVRADVSDDEDVGRIVSITNDRFGGCDLLVNNAAVSFLGPFLDVSAKRWRTVIDVNLMGAVVLSQAVLPSMLARGDGRILNIGSGAAQSDGTLQLPYSITKLALERLTTGVAHQLAGRGVAINCIRIDEVVPTEAVELHAKELAVTARSSPEQFAEAVVWVLSRPSWYSGVVLTMDQLRDVGALPA
jgi:NAD(P)-dependent dehydrogenase (short-subunit alcohol dehydrogenase family)